MNNFQQEIYKTIDILTNEKLKQLGFDKTKRGKVVSVNGTNCVVEIDGEDYSCKLRRGIYVETNDIVFVKFPQDNSVDKYVDAILGGNETPEYLVISAQEILDKLKTVDGAGSGLDADLLDGKHASEFATIDDLGDIDVDISGEAIVININESQSIIDDKNLSENVNDAINKKHSHTNKAIIDNIGQSNIDAWNTVSGKSEVGHKHTEVDIVDLDKYSKVEIDTKLNLKANESEIPTKLSDLNKDIDFDERYYTEAESDVKYEPKNNNIQSHISNKSNPHNITKNQLNLGDVENKSSSTIRSEITDSNVISALGYTPENSANKGVANGYAPLDSNIKIPLAMLPDIAKQQTYVVETITDRDNLSSLIMGEKCYTTSTGDSYIWDGDSWEILAKADWENVNLQWTNIVGKPNSNVSDIDNAVSVRHSHSNKSLIDTITQTLIDRWNAAWTHISDTIKHITAGERNKWNTVDNKADTIYVNTELNKKSDKSHLHTELDISDLDKYTKAETDTKLSGKVDNSRVLADVPHNAKFTDTIYMLPVASSAILGGIKIGANLTISEDGTLSAIDSDERTSFIIKQEIFIANEGQTVFNLTKGSYQPNTNTISLYIYGGKQPNITFNEVSSTSFEMTQPLKDGDIVIIEYFELSSATPYPIHGIDHLTGGYDPIPIATASSDGLMNKGDKGKLDGVESGANKYIHPSSHSISEVSGLQSALDSKVDDSQVLTNVPANAKFTDTTYSEITTTEIDEGVSSTLRTITARRVQYVLDKVSSMISSAIGALTKSNVGLANVDNTSDLNKPISTATQTALNSKVNNSQVLTDVPLNAVFTDTVTSINGKTGVIAKADITALGIPSQDTVYTHPATHTIAEVSSLQTALNGKVNNSQVLTNVPLNAKFTDTIYVHPTGTNPHGTTKSDVGLGSVDNTSDATKNVLSATKLTTARTINGVSFDGTTNISIVDSTKEPSFTKNTAFNKNFGDTVGTVTQGNDSRLSDARTPLTHDHNVLYNTKSETSTLLDGKVNNDRVLTDVPLGAKFTDTIYTHPTGDGNLHIPATSTTNNGKVLKAGSTAGSLVWGVDNDTITTINGKTGVISKADIVALGIPSQDTIYSHPSTHPASMITGLPTSLPANGGNADTVNGFTLGMNVPIGSKLTDTIYTHPSSHPTSMITGLATVATSGNYSDLNGKPTIPNDTNQLTKTDVYTKLEVNDLMSNAGQGDMVKGVYDTNNNGIVDDAEKLGGQSPNYYQQALGFTPVNKAGDILNGSYTGNGKLFLKNSFYGMGGQALSDFSMSGIYNRQELINVAHKGGVEVNIEGAGSVSRTKESLNLMFNGEPDFLNISGVNATTTKIEIIADLGSRSEVYSDANWQPFVQLRIAPGGSHNWFNKIRVEVSDDKINWSYPDDETAWGTDDFLNNQAIPSLWMGKNATPKPSYLWRYIRFIFTDIRGTSGNFWISQLGMRHRNAPYTKKYVTATGDKMYGALDMDNNKISNVANPTNQNDAATKGYVDAKQICHISDMPPSNKNLPWIDTSL